MNINIMLLAMSTFPPFMKHCIASYGECGESYSYFSQLEPGCKHFIYKLGNMNIGFDRIIVLCTDETLTTPKDDKGPDGMPKTQLLRNGDKAFDISDKSPYVFFKERMISYIKNEDEVFEAEKILGADTEGFTRFTHSEPYSDPENLFAPVRVEKDEVEITSSIKEVIHIIDSIPRKENEKIFLYLNAQGGARKNVQIVNTVLNMLQSRKYSLSEVNVIEFNPDHNSSQYRMLNVTGSYLKNDLAAAMNAFLQYGRADMFVDYFKRYKRERGLKTAPEDSVVNSINTISDAILLCNTDDFLKGIEQLKESVKGYDLLKNDIKDPFFELIVNDIKNSYKELFDSSDIIDDLDILVDWCMERGLIQQILTILEAKTPFFVFKRGFIYAIKSDETTQALKELKKTSKIPKYKFDNPIYLLVNTFCILNCDNEKNNNGNKTWKAKIDFVKIQKKTENIIASDYKFDMANPGICTNVYSTNLIKKNKGERNYLVEPILVPICSDWFSRYNEIYGGDPLGIKNAKDLMRDFVRLYRTICDFRNNANHSNNEIKIETIRKKIRELNNVLKTIKRQTLSGANYSFYTTDRFN